MRLGYQQQSLLSYIAANPGCSSLEARRAAVTYRRGWSNQHSDAVLSRLRNAGLVRAEDRGNRLALYAEVSA